jgi:hypothetical protein
MLLTSSFSARSDRIELIILDVSDIEDASSDDDEGFVFLCHFVLGDTNEEDVGENAKQFSWFNETRVAMMITILLEAISFMI